MGKKKSKEKPPETDENLDENLDENQDDVTDDLTDTEDNDLDGESDSTGRKPDWEASYKALQKTFQKKREDLEGKLTELEAKLGVLAQQLETTKSDKLSLVSSNTDLEKQLKEAQEKFDELSSEKDTLDQKMARRDIVMKDFPQIAKMAGYIPEGKDLDEFRENCKSFREDLGIMVDAGVEVELEGATPPPPGGDDTVSDTEEERLWTQVYNLAGVRGKEAEYKKANDRLQEILQRKESSD